MIVKRNGGMTEFIPSPQEKRESLIRDHVLELVWLMHERLAAVEEANGLPSESARQCSDLLDRIRLEEKHNPLSSQPAPLVSYPYKPNYARRLSNPHFGCSSTWADSF